MTMQRYRTGGPPHVAIIDKQGRLRFRHLGGFDRRTAEDLIDALLAGP